MDHGSRRLILVTGIPRSGTTAVGKMLALAPLACTLHEPFNYHAGLKQINAYFEIPGTPSFPFQLLDQIICKMKQPELAFKLGVFPTDKGLKRVIKSIIGGRPLNSYRRLRLYPAVKTIIWKDPLACFTADYVSKQHDVEVLLTLRNPWAVAASFKRMEWAFDLSDISTRLSQAGIDGRNTLPLIGGQVHNSVANAGVLWATIYSVLAKWATTNARIHIANLDEILADPILAYARIYQVLNLEWSDRVSKKINEFYRTTTARIVPKHKKAHDQTRDIRKVNDYWRGILTEEECDFITNLVAPYWEKFKRDSYVSS